MNYKRLAISLTLPQLAGFIGSFFTASSVSTWYALLQKPALNPPAWVFGPVWITLYFLMGISVYLVWQKNGSTFLFWMHLVVNTLWSFVFFGLKNPGWAFINLIVLWLLIVVLIFKFRKVSCWAAWLLIPYLVWVSFAGYLNYSLWKLNPNTRVLYCYNLEKDRDENGNPKCSRDGLVAVRRKASSLEETLNLLLKGELTEEEINQGITTEFPLEGFHLVGTDLQDRLLLLTFEDPLFQSSGGSCRAGILRSQVEETAKQFPGVQEVNFLPEWVFQP